MPPPTGQFTRTLSFPGNKEKNDHGGREQKISVFIIGLIRNTLKFMAIHRLDQNNFLIFKIFTFLIKRGS